MRSVVEFFWQFVLGLTGAVGSAAALVGGAAFAIGCAVCGCGYTWRRWRRKVERLAPVSDEER